MTRWQPLPFTVISAERARKDLVRAIEEIRRYLDGFSAGGTGPAGPAGPAGATGAAGADGAGFADGDYGDITISGSVTAMTVDAGAITLAKLDAGVTAVALGGAASSHGHSVVTNVADGFAPASGGGTSNFLRADGTWAAPGGGGGGGLTLPQTMGIASLRP